MGLYKLINTIYTFLHAQSKECIVALVAQKVVFLTGRSPFYKSVLTDGAILEHLNMLNSLFSVSA